MPDSLTLRLSLSIVLMALASCGGRAGTTRTQINSETNTPPANAASSTQTETKSETPFASEEGDFSVTLPQGFPAPTHVKQSQSAETGVKTDGYTSRSARGTCLVAYFEYPDSYFAGKDAKKLLEYRTSNLVRKTNATLQKKEAFSLQGHPAIALQMTVTDASSGKKSYMRRHEIMAKPRVYQIVFLTEKEDEIGKADIEAFLKSFQLKR